MAAIHILLDTYGRVTLFGSHKPKGVYTASLDVGELEFTRHEVEQIAYKLLRMLLTSVATNENG